MAESEEIVREIGKLFGMFSLLANDHPGGDLSELLKTLAWGKLFQVFPRETCEVIVENLVQSFSASYADLGKQRAESKNRSVFKEKALKAVKGNGHLILEENLEGQDENCLELERASSYTVGEALTDDFSRIEDYSSSSQITLNEERDLWVDVLAEKKRSNSLKEVELICALKNLELREQELKLKAESVNIGKKSLSITKSSLEFRISEAVKGEVAQACDNFRRTTADYYVAGLLIMINSTVFCLWKQVPNWYVELQTSCDATTLPLETNASALSKFWTWSGWRPWTSIITSNTNYMLCMGQGLLGFGMGALLGLILLFICKKTLSSSGQGKPMTIFMVGGMLIGLLGREAVDLLGGEGSNWMAVWLCLCSVHVVVHLFTGFFVRVLSRRTLLKVVFHLSLAVLLPLGAGLVGFPSLLLEAMDRTAAVVSVVKEVFLGFVGC